MVATRAFLRQGRSECDKAGPLATVDRLGRDCRRALRPDPSPLLSSERAGTRGWQVEEWGPRRRRLPENDSRRPTPSVGSLEFIRHVPARLGTRHGKAHRNIRQPLELDACRGSLVRGPSRPRSGPATVPEVTSHHARPVEERFVPAPMQPRRGVAARNHGKHHGLAASAWAVQLGAVAREGGKAAHGAQPTGARWLGTYDEGDPSLPGNPWPIFSLDCDSLLPAATRSIASSAAGGWRRSTSPAI